MRKAKSAPRSSTSSASSNARSDMATTDSGLATGRPQRAPREYPSLDPVEYSDLYLSHHEDLATAGPNCERPWLTQENDCGPALARKLLMAFWHFVRDGVSRRASFCVRHSEKRSLKVHLLTVSALSARCDRSPMTVRGGGVPYPGMALMPPHRMGPPPQASLPMRMTASWIGSVTLRIQACGRDPAPQLTSSPPVRHPDYTGCAVVLGASRYGLAMTERVATLARRPTLTAPVHDSVWDLWVGAKKRAQIEQRN